MEQSLDKKALRAVNKVIKLFSNAARWTKGSYKETLQLRGRDIQCYCVVGAFKQAACANAYSENDVSKYLVALAGNDRSVIGYLNAKRLHYGRGAESRVTRYNDDKRRTYTQIMALLGRMKSQLEAKVNAEA